MAGKTDKNRKKEDLLAPLRSGAEINSWSAFLLTVRLSIPAILAMLTSVLMQYIDASMVGHIGANASAAIGLVSSTTWLINGIVQAAGVGFTVSIAHAVGAGENERARRIVKTGLLCVLAFSGILSCLAALASPYLPVILGGADEILKDASTYFLIWALAIPFLQIRFTAGGMLECSGNIRLPSVLNIIMCVLNVILNAVLIFEELPVPGTSVNIPGAGLGVTGAALATALSCAVTAVAMLVYLLFVSEKLRFRRNERGLMTFSQIGSVTRISLPVALQSIVTGGAYVMATRLVAPLGSIALAANSLSVTAESVCYMPSYGISAAATATVGQSIGAGRKDLTRRLGWTAVFFAMGVQAVTGILLYIFAPQMIGMLTPVPEIRDLGTTVLRIEAFAEPLFGAAEAAFGVCRGTGNTLFPSAINFLSMWMIRLTLAAFLIPRLGLRGYWIAMAFELCCRGIFFLIYLRRKVLKDTVGTVPVK